MAAIDNNNVLLSIGTSMRTQKQAADRPDFNYQHTSGGNGFVFNAGFFEYVKNHLSNHFQKKHCQK